MTLKDNQYRTIEKLLPKQRGNVKIDNRNMLNALIYRCKTAVPGAICPRNSDTGTLSICVSPVGLKRECWKGYMRSLAKKD